MAADHLQFLKDRFITDFQEAVDEFGGDLPLRLHLQEILEVLQDKTIDDSTPIIIKNWLYDLRYLLANCVLSAEKERKFKTQEKKSHVNPRALKKYWFLHKTGKKLIRIRKKLQQTKNDAIREASLQPDSITVHLPENIPPLHPFETHGLVSQLHKMEAILLDRTPDDHEGVKAIGIVGMCGVGKTTLGRLFVHKFQFLRDYSPVIWVKLSLKANPLEIVTHLLTHLGAKCDQLQDLNDQLTELHNLLLGKKYLIVLDNVCHLNEWYSDLTSNQNNNGTTATDLSRFSHGLAKGVGGAIIVTSRFEEVAISMVGEKNLLRLEPTFDAEALWLTFMDSIRRKKYLTSYHHQVLSRMKDEIIYRCEGLPLAAKTLAEVISIQLAKKEYWLNSNIRKEFCLKLELEQHVSYYWNVMEKVRTLPGRCHVTEIARELAKFCHTELISVCLAVNNDPERKSTKEQKSKEVKQRKGWQRFLMPIRERDTYKIGISLF
ncbi:putative disease resistance protein RGA1 isoform X2 [Cornus florida]|uniref:putative disease resistance protein RGA1 isoform X2 n=1 Tax=Cornus florida TaxID=4283 RepID=UPI00289B8D74|nr:putative disease resistance protein RGA1 isoform X2 [Cornus florida]